ncbi:hypothetical protein DPMN_133765 [Dreissena polymorpha]|uniref:Uncharacterized protein n=1 Tax=Dreissena polymorpha TaxID=45954 RepID=A0A9D4JF54_DREPO|nr:hypothetical protein DPMN_133765 [Dreissena polymorpha]
MRSLITSHRMLRIYQRQVHEALIARYSLLQFYDHTPFHIYHRYKSPTRYPFMPSQYLPQSYPDIVVFQYLPHICAPCPTRYLDMPSHTIRKWFRFPLDTQDALPKAPPDAQMPSQYLTAPYVPKDALTTGDKALIFPLSTNHRHTAGDKALVEGATRYPDIPSQYLP